MENWIASGSSVHANMDQMPAAYCWERMRENMYQAFIKFWALLLELDSFENKYARSGTRQQMPMNCTTLHS